MKEESIQGLKSIKDYALMECELYSECLEGYWQGALKVKKPKGDWEKYTIGPAYSAERLTCTIDCRR